MRYEIWREGYRATGEQSAAQKVGEIEADSFRDACLALCGSDPTFDAQALTVWGCRLFDNETDARLRFG